MHHDTPSPRTTTLAKRLAAAHIGSVPRIGADGHAATEGSTLAAWVREWMPTMRTQIKPSTWRSYERNLEIHVLPSLGHLPLSDIKPILLTALYGDLLTSGAQRRSGGLSPTTVRYIHAIIRKTLADAVDAGLIERNPAVRAKPPRLRLAPSTQMRSWTAAQLSSFLEATRDHPLALVWRLAAVTGMRRGEVLGLRWSDIDLENARLSIRQTRISISYQVQYSTPKTHQARVVDLDPETVARFHRYRPAAPAEQALVFVDDAGVAPHPDTVSREFRAAAADADVPDIRFHDLRHTHATLALQAGIPLKVISERLGHRDPAFTLRQYAHSVPGMQAEAAKLFASLID